MNCIESRGTRATRAAIFALSLAVGLLAAGTQPATAALIAQDDAKFGPGAITLDTTTGMEWLDLTASTGRSYNEVASQLGVGGDFADCNRGC